MSTAAAPIEDFLEAITAQLDKTQDALRLKAVNRPLTFALKDFSIDLGVYVELDQDGQVRLRPSGPNESGASIIHISFTTITRPMIEENTISMELTQSQSLEEAGFAPEESQRLKRLGVRNVAQLKRLNEQADEDSLSQFSGIDRGRLRNMIGSTRAEIKYVNIGAGREQPVSRNGPERKTLLPMRPGQTRLRMRGTGFEDEKHPLRAEIDGRTLPIRSVSDTHFDIDLEEESPSGTLSVYLPTGDVENFELTFDGAHPESKSWGVP